MSSTAPIQCGRAAGVALAIMLAVSGVSGAPRTAIDGVLLTDADFAYLATQEIKQINSILQKMGPKELRRLHNLINDDATGQDPKARTNAVLELLGGFEANQKWEAENPGRLWDRDRNKTPATE